MAVVTIWLTIHLMVARVHQQHVIQYRFVPKRKKRKNRRNERNRNVISMDQRRRQQQQQLCAQPAVLESWTQTTQIVRHTTNAGRMNRYRHRWFLRAQKLVCSISTRAAPIANTLRNTPDQTHRWGIGAGTIFFRLSEMTQLIIKIIWAKPNQPEWAPNWTWSEKTKRTNPERFRRMRGAERIRRDW